MGTKMKGVFKGLRFFNHIFDDNKEQEIQIGFPTDVKHVGHIGWDGPSPSVDNSPSWMKEFKEEDGLQITNSKAKVNTNLGLGQDSLGQKSPGLQTNTTRSSDLPKTSRRQSFLAVGSTTSGSPKRSSKSKQSRKNPSDSSKTTRKQKDPGAGSNLSSRLPGLPKKSTRKKPKESSSREGSLRSGSKASPTLSDSYSSQLSDPVQYIQEPAKECHNINNQFFHTSSLKPSVKNQEKG